MNPNLPVLGALCVFLTLLPGCSSTTPTLPAPRPLLIRSCQPVKRCVLPPLRPTLNRELASGLQTTRAALEACAAEVDRIAICQQTTTP
ncbi:Rz1-like lysis system protein LysC [Paludibacterium paludis]